MSVAAPPKYSTELIALSASSNCLLFHPPRPEPFVLKSGRKSPWFFNAGLLNSGSQLDVVARSFASCLVAQVYYSIPLQKFIRVYQDP
jgi:orotate phosphoribosyltransferase